jgi:hypothetical protein
VLDDGSDALQFEAWLAVALGPNQLLVAVTVDEGAANLFLVDIEPGAATFLATMFGAAALPPRVGFAGLSANGGVPTHVAWSEYDCDPQQGRTRIYDLRTGTLTELDRALPVTIANGEDLTLGAAVHHVTTLDPETLDYGGVMPGDIGPIWADGQRWAVNGQSILELAAAERCNGVSGQSWRRQ